MIMGGVVPVVNIKGIKPGELKLTGSLLADILLEVETRRGKEECKGWTKPAYEIVKKWPAPIDPAGEKLTPRHRVREWLMVFV